MVQSVKRILIAEDEEVLRMLIVDSLEDEGYIIDEASDGIEALELFEENTYDLLLVDYMMPRLTGIEVIKKVRSYIDSKQTVKILMLTAKSQEKDIEEAKVAGADYFLAKPFSPMKLVELVEEIVNV